MSKGNQEIIKIPLKNKIVVLRIDSSEFDVDMLIDDIMKIDYSNIIGEMLTFSMIMNRIGLMRAEANDILRNEQFNFDIYKARIAESYRKSRAKSSTEQDGTKKVKPPTKDEVENCVLLDDGYQLAYKKLLRVQRNFDDIESLYWSAKSKNDILSAFAKTVTPADFEKDIVESVINGVRIKIGDKLFKSPL